jgi:hypothetical protein
MYKAQDSTTDTKTKEQTKTKKSETHRSCKRNPRQLKTKLGVGGWGKSFFLYDIQFKVFKIKS